ncbi:MAG: hypothetical protein EAX96_12520 [Candidatus Lokiarchaeota archaeon]|nr:hypothetical protein [Candidatus Lokiarchaeota archaeon]
MNVPFQLIDDDEKIEWLGKAEHFVSKKRFKFFLLIAIFSIIIIDIIITSIFPFIMNSVFFLSILIFIMCSNLIFFFLISHLNRVKKIDEDIFYYISKKRIYIYSPYMRYFVKSLYYDCVEKEFYNYVNDSDCDLSLPEFDIHEDMATIEIKKIKQIEIKNFGKYYDIYMYYFDENYTMVLRFKLTAVKDPSQLIYFLINSLNYDRICENVKIETYIKLEEVWGQN